MPKKLPQNDFRARRIVLTRDDFAYAPGPESPPTDIVAESTWASIVTLPDDVAVRTSNHHGRTLTQLHELWGAWVECIGTQHDCLFSVMLDAGDDFQSATYTALTGFYRISASALRSAIELTAIGTWAQVCAKQIEFEAWRNGEHILSFGQACDGLIGATKSLRERLRAVVDDSLFDQKTSNYHGGFARRIFDGVCNFVHARPGYADGDLRSSNGPIYVRSTFNHVAWLQFETFGLCFAMHLLARPYAIVPMAISKLLSDVERLKSRVTRAAIEALVRRG